MDVITTIQNMGKRLKENEKMIYSLNSSLRGQTAKIISLWKKLTY